jgi:hypothetical protein
LITEKKYLWHSRENYVLIDPQKEPVYIFKINKNIAATQSFELSELALEHSKIFFELREKVVKHNDVYARRKLAELFNQQILLRVYTGETFDVNYAESINNEAKKYDFISIIHAYITAPGH